MKLEPPHVGGYGISKSPSTAEFDLKASRILRNAATIGAGVVLVLFAVLTPSTAAEIATLAETFSGHIAVLPSPSTGDLASTPVGRTLVETKLAPHVHELTPAQFADTNFFDARRFPVALYLGHESYFQTVRQARDGDAALRNFLAGGGTLLVLPCGPFPLYYNERFQPANGLGLLGLNLGAGSFEKAPPGLKLTFRANTNQTALRWPATEFPFPSVFEADQRWRPSRAPAAAEARYTPLVTLFDDRGGNHGEGAAVIEFVQGPLRGGRVLYVWLSLLADRESRMRVVPDALRWALTGRSAPATTQLHDNFDGRQEVLGADAIWLLRAGQWKLDQGALVGENCVSDLFEAQGAARGNTAWRDYVLTVRFKIESRGSDWRDGLWFGVRCREDGDGYHLTFTDHDCQLHKAVYGISTSDANPLARVPFKPDQQWHTLRVEARANRLKAQLDGAPLFDVKDDAHLHLPSLRSGGIVLSARQGSASQGRTVVRFDDVSVKLLEE
ncbi:MAG: hypothetical protein HZA90_02895 [Verrucomicrobia bacterium]|nr:hypothetical protein [Verrucomicrobiota bacterium]